MTSMSPVTAPSDGRRVRALLIDYGGVLTVPLGSAFRGIAADAGLEPSQVLGVLGTHEGARCALVQHEVGQLDDEGFEDAFAAALVEAGGKVEARGLLAALGAHLELDLPMIDMVRRIRAAGVPVALVSNSLGRDCYSRIDRDELFDVSVISAQVGVRKPSREIYRIACSRLGVAPDECLLVDDLEHNLVGAARLGITGVLHRTAEETIGAVHELLHLPAPSVAGE